MKIGCCLPGDFRAPGYEGETTIVTALEQGYQFLLACGYDYLEFHVGGIVGMTEEEFAAAVELHQQGKLTIEACNCFVPASLPLIGPDRDPVAIREYLEKAFNRMAKLGVEVVVFGSGGARRVPRMTCMRNAWEQLDWFMTTAEEIARSVGITVVIEPLNRGETNVIFTVQEGLKIAKRLDLPNLKVLADVFHMYLEDESLDVIGACGDMLRHVHISDPVKRTPPEDCEYLRETADALRKAGYTGRVSIEAGFSDFVSQVQQAQPLMRELFG